MKKFALVPYSQWVNRQQFKEDFTDSEKEIINAKEPELEFTSTCNRVRSESERGDEKDSLDESEQKINTELGDNKEILAENQNTNNNNQLSQMVESGDVHKTDQLLPSSPNSEGQLLRSSPNSEKTDVTSAITQNITPTNKQHTKKSRFKIAETAPQRRSERNKKPNQIRVEDQSKNGSKFWIV